MMRMESQPCMVVVYGPGGRSGRGALGL
jgi:hypothetical protein